MKDWNVSIYRGILTGYNEAFIIDGTKRAQLIEQDPKSVEIIRPILRGRDIKRYGYEFADLWLICTHNGIKERGIRAVNVENYPAIKEHLDKYYKEIKKRQDQGDSPYNLRNCAYWDDFSKQKIMYNDICQRLSFCLVPKDVFCLNTVYFISDSPRTKYLLAVLNSCCMNWYYRTLSVQLGEQGVRMFSIYVLKLPIPIPNESVKKNVETLIDRRMLSTQLSEMQSIDYEINAILCDLYHLTKEEIDYLNRQ